MKRVFDYIRQRFWLRNILMAICLTIIASFLVGLMLNIFTRHGEKHAVPNFTSKSFDEAKKLAEKADLELIIADSIYIPKGVPGLILDQSPKEGMGVKSGRKVFLTINAFRPRMAAVPFVTGFSLRQAKNKLESSGFEIDRLVYRPDMATNHVLGASFGGKEITQGSNVMAELGSGITLTVGRDSESPMPMTPKLIGLTLREAKSRLWEVGFNVGEVRYDIGVKPEEQDKAKIYKQSPSQEARAEFGTRISLTLTNNISKTTESSAQADIDAREVPVVEEEVEN